MLYNVPMTKIEKTKEKYGYLLLLPWIILFMVFFLFPLVYGIFVSFTNYSLGKMEFIGLENYKNIFNDSAFWKSLLATILYCVLVIPFRVFIPLWAASILKQHGRKMNTFVKMLMYLPGVTCTVALVLSWDVLLFPNTGIINQIFIGFGFERFSLFDSPYTSIPTISLLVILCNLGSNLIIFSGAINNIPNVYYENAELEGASKKQQFFNITLPLLNSTIVYTIITSTIATLQIFVVPQLLTGGGPNYSTSSLLMLIYSSAFTRNQFGYASAIGSILFIINAVIAFAQYKTIQKETIEY